jgi:hypothetical protein
LGGEQKKGEKGRKRAGRVACVGKQATSAKAEKLLLFVAMKN